MRCGRIADWKARGCNLGDIGVNKANAISELKPKCPRAHRWYNAWADGTYYERWEHFFTYWLMNKLYYFFHRRRNRKIEVAFSGFPGRVEDGKLIPPPLPKPIKASPSGD